jgi:hypothetical protein
MLNAEPTVEGCKVYSKNNMEWLDIKPAASAHAAAMA